jgi:hypothetical protein
MAATAAAVRQLNDVDDDAKPSVADIVAAYRKKMKVRVFL